MRRIARATLVAAVLALFAAAPAHASTTAVSITGADDGTVAITGVSGAQAIRVENCTAFGNQTGICVTDTNACSSGVVACMQPSGGCGTFTDRNDNLHENEAFCANHNSGRDSFDAVTADLGGFDDGIFMATDLPLTADGGTGDDELQGGGGNDNLSGGDDNDTVDGNDGNDTIRGGAGNNSLLGGKGSDTFIPSSGPDAIHGGEDGTGDDVDTVDYSTATTGFDVTIGNGQNDGPDGNDDVEASIEKVIGGSGNDRLIGDNTDNILDGRAGADSVQGNGGDDLLLGGAGNDTLSGGDGNDTASYAGRTADVTADLDGTGGQSGESDGFVSVENLIGGNGDDTLSGTIGDNAISGGLGNDTLHGKRGSDKLVGGEGDDILDGEGDDDSFVSEPGRDTFDGGTGTDFLSYRNSPGPVVVDLTGVSSGEGVNAGGGPSGAEGDRILNVENAQGSVSTTGDRIVGNGGPNLLIGDNRNDGNTSPSALDSQGGPDLIFGGGGNDTIQGNAGDDSIIPGPGNDTVLGGFGNEDLIDDDTDNDNYDGGNPGTAATIDYSRRTDPVTVDLEAGSGGIAGETDTLVHVNSAVGGTGNDTLRGDDATAAGLTNTLIGIEGDDQLFGRGGNDTLNGGPGKDELDGGTGTDQLDGGSGGNDVVDYSERTAPVTVDLTAGTGGEAGENDVLVHIFNVWGGAANDQITGDAGPNVLYGNEGNDTISSGDGADKVIGGAGVDSLDAGPADDNVDAIDNVADTIVCGDGNDALAADPADPSPADCETISGVSPTSPPPASTPPPGAVLPPPPGQPGSTGPPEVGGGVENGAFVGVQIGTVNPGNPTLSGFAASPKKFKVGRKPTPAKVLTAVRVKAGTTFRYSANEPGIVNVVLKRLRGRGRGLKGGTLTRSAKLGANSIPFTGRVGSKALAPGSYKATLTEIDPSGLRSAPVNATFTVSR